MKFFNPFKIFRNVAHQEVQEIKSLKLTDEDKDQAKKITAICIAAMVSQGIIVPPFAEPILEKAVGYGLRDLKDGLETPSKLILLRVVREIRKDISENKG